jgi:hypothetical protein
MMISTNELRLCYYLIKMLFFLFDDILDIFLVYNVIMIFGASHVQKFSIFVKSQGICTHLHLSRLKKSLVSAEASQKVCKVADRVSSEPFLCP